MSRRVSLPSDRSFGLTFVAIFLLLTAYQAWRGYTLGTFVFAAIALADLIVSLLCPARLHPLNRAWMKFGALLHWIVSPVALAAMFFVAFVPIGLMMRLFGYDPMKRKFDSAAPSYWVIRNPPGPPPDSLHNQF